MRAPAIRAAAHRLTASWDNDAVVPSNPPAPACFWPHPAPACRQVPGAASRFQGQSGWAIAGMTEIQNPHAPPAVRLGLLHRAQINRVPAARHGPKGGSGKSGGKGTRGERREDQGGGRRSKKKKNKK